MEGKRFIRTMRLKNMLSYGPGSAELSLEPLNVLIGPNASGKSNLIEALSLLADTPRDLQKPIREGGGVHEWLWKGGHQTETATLDVTVDYPKGRLPLRYRLSFMETGSRFDLRDEAIENEIPIPPNERPYLYYVYQEGRPTLNVFVEADLPESDKQPNRHLGDS